MGCNSSVDSSCHSDEVPQHTVTLSAFEVDKTEVTVAQYASCVSAGGCNAPDFGTCYTAGGVTWGVFGKEQHPINCVTWYDAEDYCAFAGKRLCTEAEWEKAARGTDGRKYPWGNEDASCDYAVMDENGQLNQFGCGLGSTWAVGSKLAGVSPSGALDMAGNVWEWTADWYSSSYYGSSPASSPAGPSSGSERVFRGGSLFDEYPWVRASIRVHGRPFDHAGYVGVRCCRSAP